MTTLKQPIALALIALTWLAIAYTAALFTTLIMAPWDTALVRPEIGTWQRTVNDLFETGAGVVVGIALVLVGIALTVPVLRRSRVTLPRLVIGNAAFCAVLWAAFLLAAFVNNELLYPYPSVNYDPSYAGFHRSVLPMTAQIVSWALWLLWLRRLGTAQSPSSRAVAAA